MRRSCRQLIRVDGLRPRKLPAADPGRWLEAALEANRRPAVPTAVWRVLKDRARVNKMTPPPAEEGGRVRPLSGSGPNGRSAPLVNSRPVQGFCLNSPVLLREVE